MHRLRDQSYKSRELVAVCLDIRVSVPQHDGGVSLRISFQTDTI